MNIDYNYVIYFVISCVIIFFIVTLFIVLAWSKFLFEFLTWYASLLSYISFSAYSKFLSTCFHGNARKTDYTMLLFHRCGLIWDRDGFFTFVASSIKRLHKWHLFTWESCYLIISIHFRDASSRRRCLHLSLLFLHIVMLDLLLQFTLS